MRHFVGMRSESTGLDRPGALACWPGGSALADRAEPIGSEGRFRDLAFHPSGREIVTASEDGTARVWSLPLPTARLESPRPRRVWRVRSRTWPTLPIES